LNTADKPNFSSTRRRFSFSCAAFRQIFRFLFNSRQNLLETPRRVGYNRKNRRRAGRLTATSKLILGKR
jgi:hypothetical protein